MVSYQLFSQHQQNGTRCLYRKTNGPTKNHRVLKAPAVGLDTITLWHERQTMSVLALIIIAQNCKSRPTEGVIYTATQDQAGWAHYHSPQLRDYQTVLSPRFVSVYWLSVHWERTLAHCKTSSCCRKWYWEGTCSDVYIEGKGFEECSV